MKRILLIGAGGQVGQELQHKLAPLGEVVAVGRSQLDLTEPVAIRQILAQSQPDVVVNAAAYTAVDQAETDSEIAHTVNAIAPTLMAEEAQQLGAALIHISTDYVFNGQNYQPYTEEDSTAPLNVYGRSKLAGEEGIRNQCHAHVILRTAWVYGTFGKGNFVKTMLRLGAEREELRVVADQIGSPTYAQDIAFTISQLVAKLDASQSADNSIFGTYHFTNSGVASWYDFAVAIFEEAQAVGFPVQIKQVVPITSSEYPTPAHRPSYSVLSCKKVNSLLGECPPHWRQSLRRMLVELYGKTYESAYSIRG